jgi:uncharacterized protein
MAQSTTNTKPTHQRLEGAIKLSDLAAVQSLLTTEPSLLTARHSSGVSWSMLALYQGSVPISELLRSGRPLLDDAEAAAFGDLEMLSRAEPNAFSPDGFTLLGLACFFDQPEAAKLLLARGADPNLAANNDRRVAPIHAVAARCNILLLQTMLRHGADPNLKQHGGLTALHTVAAHGKLAMVEMLLSHGANPRPATDHGLTPATLARQNSHLQIATLLEGAPLPA